MPQRLLFTSLPALYSVTLFVSAGLLFTVELMIAKMILPLFGGTPAVWNTCMMFFQAMLLAGYGYAHLSSTRLALNRQIMIQLAVLAAACLVLPIAVPRGLAPDGEYPIGWILLLLTLSIGLPFFGISAMAPLLQRWFARTGHPAARDPYFLYSASNLGSMLALIGYPLWIEPRLRLIDQGRAWAAFYLVMLLLTLLCAAAVRRYTLCAPTVEGQDSAAGGECGESAAAPPHRQRILWVCLAFVPSSLLLGVTTFLSTDVAAIPLFWVVPLALYLLSFILVFARLPAWVHRVSVRLLPVALAVVIFVDFSDIDISKGAVFALHLLNLFVCCLVCHGEIARTRPAASHLTEFYLLMSIGGVLGGIFNSLLAPVIFDTVFEYPLVLVGAALLLPVGRRSAAAAASRWRAVVLNLALYLALPLTLGTAAYWVAAKWTATTWNLTWLTDRMDLTPETLFGILTLGSLVLVCWGLSFFRRPLLFGVGIAAVLLTTIVAKDLKQNILYRERSFFGVLTVTRDSFNEHIYLSHGTTLHGMQRTDPERRQQPVAYYHPQGPAGQVFAEFSGPRKKAHIAVTGLGTGSLAYYAGPGQRIDFYEIDPVVKEISTQPEYFTFLADCKAEWRVILGDARLTMAKASPNYYGIIALDAFSSDSIPVHLLTREAVFLYLSKLREDGVLLIHISNKYIDLAPVLARLAEELGLEARINDDDENEKIDKYGSAWVLMARKEADLGSLARSEAWKRLAAKETVGFWTDDFSNLLSVFKW